MTRSMPVFLTALLCIGFASCVNSWAKTPTGRFAGLRAKLIQNGFDPSRMLMRRIDQQALKYQLLRVRSENRLYDISVFDEGTIYLAVSFDAGKKFGEALKFQNVDRVVKMIVSIEARHVRQRKQLKDDIAATYLAEQRRDKETTRNSKPRQLNTRAKSANKAIQSIADILSASNNTDTTTASSGSDAQQQVEQVDSAAKQAAQEAGGFSNSDCGSPSNGFAPGDFGGIAATAAVLTEAVVLADAASFLHSGTNNAAMAKAPGSTGLNSDSELDRKRKGKKLRFQGKDDSGKQIQDRSADKSAKLRQRRIARQDKQRLDRLKKQLKQLIRQRSNSVNIDMKRYYNELAKIGANKNKAKKQLTTLLARTSFDRSFIDRIRKHSPSDNPHAFYWKTENYRLILDADRTSDKELLIAFLVGGSLYVEQTKLKQAIQSKAKLTKTFKNRSSDQSMLFESEVQAAQETEQQWQKQVIESHKLMQDLNRLVRRFQKLFSEGTS